MAETHDNDPVSSGVELSPDTPLAEPAMELTPEETDIVAKGALMRWQQQRRERAERDQRIARADEFTISARQDL